MISNKNRGTLGSLLLLVSFLLAKPAWSAPSDSRQLNAATIRNGSAIVTLPISTSTLSTLALIETLTNKTMAVGANSFTGTASKSCEFSIGGLLQASSFGSPTNANTASAVVARDASGNFSAGTISAALSGNASTSTALAANPADCAAGNLATTIAANGDLTCTQVSDSHIALSAAIARSKIASGAADRIVINAPTTGALSELALTSGQVVLGSAGNAPSAATVTGDVTISNTGVTAISPGVIVDADVNATAAIAISKLGTVTASRAIESGAGGSLQASAVTTTELARLSGVTGALYFAGGTDVAVADGGTNLSSYTAGDILYASAATTLAKRPIGSAGQVLTVAAGLPVWSSPVAGVETVVTKAAADSPYSVPAAGYTVLVNATAGAVTTNFPAAAANSGGRITVVKIDTTTNRVTQDGNAAETLSGTATQVIGAAYNFQSWISDGANWFPVSDRRHVSGKMSFSGSQLITSAFSKIQFSGNDRDTIGTINDTVNERFVAPYAGRYRVYWNMVMSAGNAQDYRMQFEVQRTGATRHSFGDSRKSAADASNQSFTYTWEEDMAVGDYMELFARWVGLGADRNYTEGQAYFEKID